MRQEHNINWRPLVWVRIAVLGLVAACTAESTHGQVPGAAAGARKFAARVNGQPIYEDQLKPKVEKGLQAYRRYGMRKDDANPAKRLRAKVLNQLIGDMLVRQECNKRTIENIDEKVDQRVKDLEKKYGAGQGMERYLRLRRVTMDELRESLKERVQIDEYLKEQGVLEPEVPESRIREMYEADPESFSKEETVRVSHVLIAVDPHSGPEKKEQALQKAEQVRKEILEGKDFAEMAKAHSDCKSAPNGGDLGNVRKGFMPPQFETAALALEKDAVSEVVETKFGYHIIKVVDKQSASLVPYDEMRDFIKKYLQNGESKKKLAAHIVDLKKKAEIEIYQE